ncbi:hypothetical protein, partial [Cohnella fermenti]|uniref:hypothetical protein n=1 Tax=Cohnella fermenti TaxID=2565925 RepID=UPI001B3B2967
TTLLPASLQDSLLVAWLRLFQAGFPPAKLLNLCSVALVFHIHCLDFGGIEAFYAIFNIYAAY